MLMSDVCLSHTSELSREQRGLGRPKLTEIANVTRDSDTTFKIKGQGHQAALLTAVLAHQAAAAVAWERVGRGKLLLRCRLLCGARHFGAHGGGEGRGHIVAAARLQLVLNLKMCIVFYRRSRLMGPAAPCLQWKAVVCLTGVVSILCLSVNGNFMQISIWTAFCQTNTVPRSHFE